MKILTRGQREYPAGTGQYSNWQHNTHGEHQLQGDECVAEVVYICLPERMPRM